MEDSNHVPEEPGAVRLHSGKVEVFDGERWGPYRALSTPPGVRPQYRCMKHDKGSSHE